MGTTVRRNQSANGPPRRTIPFPNARLLVGAENWYAVLIGACHAERRRCDAMATSQPALTARSWVQHILPKLLCWRVFVAGLECGYNQNRKPGLQPGYVAQLQNRIGTLIWMRGAYCSGTWGAVGTTEPGITDTRNPQTTRKLLRRPKTLNLKRSQHHPPTHPDRKPLLLRPATPLYKQSTATQVLRRNECADYGAGPAAQYDSSRPFGRCSCHVTARHHG